MDRFLKKLLSKDENISLFNQRNFHYPSFFFFFNIELSLCLHLYIHLLKKSLL